MDTRITNQPDISAYADLPCLYDNCRDCPYVAQDGTCSGDLPVPGDGQGQGQ